MIKAPNSWLITIAIFSGMEQIFFSTNATTFGLTLLNFWLKLVKTTKNLAATEMLAE